MNLQYDMMGDEFNISSLFEKIKGLSGQHKQWQQQWLIRQSKQGHLLMIIGRIAL